MGLAMYEMRTPVKALETIVSVNAHTASGLQEVSGIALRVDALARELTLAASGQKYELTVPPGCDIRLNGEAVRLRLIQPRDLVCVVIQARDDIWVARSIRVESLARRARR
jgi:hypothetical protein